MGSAKGGPGPPAAPGSGDTDREQTVPGRLYRESARSPAQSWTSGFQKKDTTCFYGLRASHPWYELLHARWTGVFLLTSLSVCTPRWGKTTPIPVR